jgi:hypothetical protein
VAKLHDLFIYLGLAWLLDLSIFTWLLDLSLFAWLLMNFFYLQFRF